SCKRCAAPISVKRDFTRIRPRRRLREWLRRFAARAIRIGLAFLARGHSTFCKNLRPKLQIVPKNAAAPRQRRTSLPATATFRAVLPALRRVGVSTILGKLSGVSELHRALIGMMIVPLDPLQTPLIELPGAGPRLEALDRLGVRTVGDLLFHLPRAYE